MTLNICKYNKGIKFKVGRENSFNFGHARSEKSAEYLDNAVEEKETRTQDSEIQLWNEDKHISG